MTHSYICKICFLTFVKMTISGVFLSYERSLGYCRSGVVGKPNWETMVYRQGRTSDGPGVDGDGQTTEETVVEGLVGSFRYSFVPETGSVSPLSSCEPPDLSPKVTSECL